MQISNQQARMAEGMLGSGSALGATSYGSLAEMQESLLAQGRQFTRDYASKFASSEGGGKVSVDDLKAQLAQEFPQYSFSTSNPKDVAQGQNLLHIDQANLQKMADNPSYRAEVMGLIKREASSLGAANVQMGGQTVRFQMTGSVVSISNENPTVDGIPYAGSATSSSSSISTSSTGSSAKTTKGNTSRPTMRELLEEMAEKRAEEKREQERLEKAAQQQQTVGSDRVDILV